MARAIAALAIAACIATVGACATLGSNKGYVVCNDTQGTNVTCPNPATVVVKSK